MNSVARAAAMIALGVSVGAQAADPKLQTQDVKSVQKPALKTNQVTVKKPVSKQVVKTGDLKTDAVKSDGPPRP